MFMVHLIIRNRCAGTGRLAIRPADIRHPIVNGTRRRARYQAFQRPCRLQYSRADTWAASMQNIASGASPGFRNWR